MNLTSLKKKFDMIFGLFEINARLVRVSADNLFCLC